MQGRDPAGTGESADPASTEAANLEQQLFDAAEVEAALHSIEREAATDLEEFLATLEM